MDVADDVANGTLVCAVSPSVAVELAALVANTIRVVADNVRVAVVWAVAVPNGTWVVALSASVADDVAALAASGTWVVARNVNVAVETAADVPNGT